MPDRSKEDVYWKLLISYHEAVHGFSSSIHQCWSCKSNWKAYRAAPDAGTGVAVLQNGIEVTQIVYKPDESNFTEGEARWLVDAWLELIEKRGWLTGGGFKPIDVNEPLLPEQKAELEKKLSSLREPQWSQEWPTKEGWYHRWEVGRQVESYFLPINEIQSDMARKYMIDYWWLPATGRYQVPEPPKPQEGGR